MVLEPRRFCDNAVDPLSLEKRQAMQMQLGRSDDAVPRKVHLPRRCGLVLFVLVSASLSQGALR